MILVVCPNPSIDTEMEFGDFQSASVNRAISQQYFPGGKGVHVALALAEYKQPVLLLAFWGGATGKWLRELCEQQNVACVGPYLEDWTRFSIIINQPGRYKDTQILGKGPCVNNREIDIFFDWFKTTLADVSWVVMSGSLPVGCPESFYQDLIKIANAKQVPVLLDTSIEPLKVAEQSQLFGIHLNESESLEETGLVNVSMILGALDKTARMKIITRGEEGLFLSMDGEILHSNVQIQQVISTVGCGDCLMAGIVTGLYQGASFREVAKLGVAFGAANCLRDDLGMLYKQDIDKLLPKVTVENLK